MTTQKDRILARLKEGTWLSTEEMTLTMHIFGGGQRIHDLRNEGHNIIERKIAGKRTGEYKLIPPAPIKLPEAFPHKQTTNSLFQ